MYKSPIEELVAGIAVFYESSTSNIWHSLWGDATMTDFHSSNVARNKSFEIRVEDTMDDERLPKGRDRPPTVLNLFGRSREPVIQENLERPVTAAHLKNVLNDFQCKIVAVI